jgi:hypothetical protein
MRVRALRPVQAAPGARRADDTGKGGASWKTDTTGFWQHACHYSSGNFNNLRNIL